MSDKLESVEDKPPTRLKKLYVQRSFQIGIFRASVFILGKEKFSIRLEIAWGWSK